MVHSALRYYKCHQVIPNILDRTTLQLSMCRGQMKACMSVCLFGHLVFIMNAGFCRSVDAALRRSIPAFNKDVKEVQARMEDIAFKLRIPQRKPWQGMADNAAASLALAQQQDKVWLLGCYVTVQLHAAHFCLQSDMSCAARVCSRAHVKIGGRSQRHCPHPSHVHLTHHQLSCLS